MTDVLIRNVSESQLARIDELAKKLGLSRNEYLRRRIEQDANLRVTSVTATDFERLTTSDLLDDDVMRDAWS